MSRQVRFRVRRALFVGAAVVAGVGGPAVLPAPPVSADVAVGVNVTLASGQSLSSGSRGHTLAMQTDGNLVWYINTSQGQRAAVWASNTAGRSGSYAVMQSDGNLVLYQPVSGGGRRAVWASNTGGRPGSQLVAQDDGNLVIYQPVAGGRRAVWASNTSAASVERYDEFRFLDLMNRERQSSGLAPFKMSTSLIGSAEAYSVKMASTNRFEHASDAAILADCGRASAQATLCGENLGLTGVTGSEVAVLHQALMNSTLHRANILGNFTHVGVGVYRSGGRYWLTVRFMKTSGAVTIAARPPGL